MGLFEKLYTVFISVSVVVGFLVGQLNGIEKYANYLIQPLLMLMLYVTFLQIPMKDIKRAFLHRSFTFTNIGINFILTPLLAWLLAFLFLSDSPALWVGFIMLMVTPCTDWYLIFTGIAKGNVALSTSILPLNLVLQLLLLPVYLYLFSGAVGVVDFFLVVKSMLLVLFLPFILARFTRVYLRKRKQEKRIEKMSSLPVIFLCLAIASMFASQGELLLKHVDLFATLLLPILIFFLLNFIIGRFIGRILQWTRADITSLHFTTLARNSPIALAIAMTAFPHEPLIALVLIIGPLIELPLLAFVSYFITFLNRRTIHSLG